MKTLIAALVTVLLAAGGGLAAMADTSDCTDGNCNPPPDCTNGDCNPPPDCTNGDCNPPPDCSNGDCEPPPSCSNGDCEPPPDCSNGDCTGGLESCCCVGPNTPGTNRVCCCPSTNLDGLTCRLSLVLDSGYPDNWHQTLDQVTLNGRRAPRCDMLLQRYCNPPEEEVCARVQNQTVCTRVLKAACQAIAEICQYRFCAPEWFPWDEPAPQKAGCEWWSRIRPCLGN